MNPFIQEANQQFVSVYNRYPIILDHGEGMYLYDTDGKRYPGLNSLHSGEDYVDLHRCRYHRLSSHEGKGYGRPRLRRPQTKN